LSDYRLKLLPFVANFYFCSIHNSLNLFLPKNLIEKIKKDKLNFDKTSKYDYSFNFSNKLTKIQEETYNNIKLSKNNKVLLF
jgi:hypothetical protein